MMSVIEPTAPALPGAVYMGNGRVLCRLRLPEYLDPDVIFLVDSNEITFVPRLIMDSIYQPDSTRFTASIIRPESHCIDVGANFGYFTCMLGRLAHKGRVIGIEADPGVSGLLQTNVEINWVGAVATALNRAVADKSGVLKLRRHKGYSANTTIAFDEAAPDHVGVEIFEVEAITVDSLLPKMDGRVDFMKVDVEGAEPLVFRGARETIAANPQITIVMEWSPGQLTMAGCSPETFVKELTAMGLSPFAINPGGGAEPTTWDAVTKGAYCDIMMKRDS